MELVGRFVEVGRRRGLKVIVNKNKVRMLNGEEVWSVRFAGIGACVRI